MSKSSYWRPCHPSEAELKACSFYEVFHDSSITRGVMAPLFLSLMYLITISSWHLLLSYKKRAFSLPSETYSPYVLRLALNLQFSFLSIPGSDIVGMFHHTWVIIFSFIFSFYTAYFFSQFLQCLEPWARDKVFFSFVSAYDSLKMWHS